MSPMRFADRISRGEPIDVFNHGHQSRDFTYIDDIVEGVIRSRDHPAKPNATYDAEQPESGSSSAPYRVYNIGNDQPVQRLRFIELLETHLSRSVESACCPCNLATWPIPGRMFRVYAMTWATRRTPPSKMARFAQRYLDYHNG